MRKCLDFATLIFAHLGTMSKRKNRTSNIDHLQSMSKYRTSKFKICSNIEI